MTQVGISNRSIFRGGGVCIHTPVFGGVLRK